LVEAPLEAMRTRRLQRIVLTSFVVTFVCARIVVFLIMTRDIPDLYIHVGGTHVHHLNFGIFLLSIVGAVLLFSPPAGKWRDVLAATYGVGLALTFDEFGMWLHMGGSYWQRGSFDAITVIAALLALAAYMPPPRRWSRRRLAWTVLLLCLVGLFFWRLSVALSPLEGRTLPRLEQIERQAPR